MITTGCEGCCFLKKKNEDQKCTLNQFCNTRDGRMFAPGYCRMCRSHKWAKKHGESDPKKLHRKIVEEQSLRFDMLIFFDEATNSVAHLERTLNSGWYVKYARKIIIMDVTGFGSRKNLALRYIKSREHSVPTIVDSSAAHESEYQQDETIHRVSKQVEAPFFLVLPAGSRFADFDSVAQMIKEIPSRVIHWSFPFVANATAIISGNPCCGLFITIPYRSLMKSPEVSFHQRLKQEEIETGMGLSWFCSDTLLV